MTTAQAQGPQKWLKASRSTAGNACVEMRRHEGRIQVRDSKNPEGPVLSFTREEFDAWLDGAKKAEFDHLLG